LVPPSLSGEGYEVSLSLESSFQMADSGNPSIGAAAWCGRLLGVDLMDQVVEVEGWSARVRRWELRLRPPVGGAGSGRSCTDQWS
jgi:hypothetical protein